MRPDVGEVWIVRLEDVGANGNETAFDLVYIQNDLENYDSLVMLDTDDKEAIEMYCLGEAYSYEAVSEFIARVEDAEIYED